MRVFNLKTAARTLIYLKEHGIDSYDELREKSDAAFIEFNRLSSRLKEVESRQKEVSAAAETNRDVWQDPRRLRQVQSKRMGQGFFRGTPCRTNAPQSGKKVFRQPQLQWQIAVNKPTQAGVGNTRHGTPQALGRIQICERKLLVALHCKS
jgi:hypothetical protein